MVNFNTKLVANNEAVISLFNRGLQYGDAVFETLKVVDDKILFWEDHYFRLMASMRILRMDIPMNFTFEFLQNEILKTTKANTNNDSNTFRVKLIIWRKTGGKYTPKTQEISFAVSVEPLLSSFYTIKENAYTVALYKDHYVSPDLLSTIKSTNRIINVLGGIFAQENDFDNCLLLNTNKNVIEALNGNIFLVLGDKIKTPPLADGCIKGIIRKQIIKILNSTDQFELVEESISPFELQKADELFITNIISGIVPVTQYRKKTYKVSISINLLAKLNALARMS